MTISNAILCKFKALIYHHVNIYLYVYKKQVIATNTEPHATINHRKVISYILYI